MLVIMAGGIAAIAVGFGEYLGSFIPFFSATHTFFHIGGWAPNGGQLAAVLAILLLTTINHFGVREGATTQNILTPLQGGAIVAVVAFGLAPPSHAAAAVPAGAAGR